MNESEKLQQALEVAERDPASAFAVELRKRIQNGDFNETLKAQGVDTSGFGAVKKEGILKRFGKSLIKSETEFGKSIAGAIDIGASKFGIGPTAGFERAQSMQAQTISQLVARIKEKRQAGEDTSRLMKLLESMKGTGIKNELLERQADLTPRQVVGQAAGVATDIGGALIGGGVAKSAVTKPISALSGALQGARAGATTGAFFGAAQGTARGLQEDLSGSQLATEGVVGGIVGGATGGLLGAVTGGISGFFRGRKITAENFSKEFVTPKMSTKERSRAIFEGRFEDPTLFKKAEIAISKRDRLLANAVDDVISPKKTLGDNISSIRSKIDNTDAGVAAYIERNKVPFNTNQLRSRLNAGKSDLKLIFASDASAEKTYNAVADAFMDNVGKKDTAGLFSGRKTFDNIPAVRKLLESDKLGENARKEIVLAIRRSANEYVANQLPKGNQYRNLLLEEHYMLEALGNIADKAATGIGKNKLQVLLQQYPTLRWIIGGATAGAAGTVGLGSLFGN